jgi:hypothetical protein
MERAWSPFIPPHPGPLLSRRGWEQGNNILGKILIIAWKTRIVPLRQASPLPASDQLSVSKISARDAGPVRPTEERYLAPHPKSENYREIAVITDWLIIFPLRS